MNIKALQARLRGFAHERNWDQVDSPKNLSMALAVEAGELLEIFQWMTKKDSNRLSKKNKKHAAKEIADVFIYLLTLADKLDIDINKAVQNKIKTNAKKYPAGLSKEANI